MNQILKDRFINKVMIITGAASGIGKATAIRAAKEGAKVVIADLNEKGKDLEKTINNDGGEAIFIKSNLTCENEVKNLVKKTINRFGKIDVLINNAGVSDTPIKVSEITQEDFDRTFKTNLYSVFLCSKYVITEFIKQNNGGAIVNTASIAGLVGLPGTPAYIASKHAINGLTKNMAIDYAKYNIRVNSINPAATKTPMQEDSYKMVEKILNEAIKKGLLTKENAMSSLGDKVNNIQHRLAEASEQAASILFLASDEASYITGTTMQTDGGWTAF